MIHEKRVYSLTCDGCGETFYDALGFRDHDDDAELLCAVKHGWIGEKDRYPFLENILHFCCEKCREEWKKRTTNQQKTR